MRGSAPCAARGASGDAAAPRKGGIALPAKRAFHGSDFRQKGIFNGKDLSRKGPFGRKKEGGFGASKAFSPHPPQMRQRPPSPGGIAAAHACRGTIKRMQLLHPCIKGTGTSPLPILACMRPHAVRTPDRTDTARTNAARAARALERGDSEKRTSAERAHARNAPTEVQSEERASIGLALAERTSVRNVSAGIASAEPASTKSAATERTSAGRISAEHALAERISTELAFAERTLAKAKNAPAEYTSEKRPESTTDAAASRRASAERR
ncbi:hypothetical protein B5F40_13600 [Gordonibacter sp. An230]|nr:hypothetical protein B5F40_13600 [Gordonibacter sp. An230]